MINDTTEIPFLAEITPTYDQVNASKGEEYRPGE